MSTERERVQIRNFLGYIEGVVRLDSNFSSQQLYFILYIIALMGMSGDPVGMGDKSPLGMGDAEYYIPSPSHKINPTESEIM